MKACGIVVEYNPFHNGHKYHIEKAREITGCEVLIAVMSANFVQRGEPAIIDKWQRTRAALENDVDLVIELPFVYSNQSATQFAYGSVELLKLARVSDIVFGSETNNLEELKEISAMSVNPDNLREKLAQGYSYPKAYGLMAGSYFPNDILAIAYLKALSGSEIKAHSIQRSNHYHGEDLQGEIASAKAIRRALVKQENISCFTPMAAELAGSKLHYIDDYYPYLRSMLLTLPKEYLQEIFLFSEGIENHFIKNALLYPKYEDFLNNCISRRYTRSRIQRALMSLLVQLTKEEARDLPHLDTLRILGFNEKGQRYLKELKQQEINIATRFNQVPKAYRQLEYRATVVYSYPDSATDKIARQEREVQGPLILKNKKIC